MRRGLTPLVLVALVVLVPGHHAAGQVAPPAKAQATATTAGGHKIEETRLGPWVWAGMVGNQLWSTAVISADGRHVANAGAINCENDARTCICLDGHAVMTTSGGMLTFWTPSVNDLILSRGGERLAYHRDGKWVVVDGQGQAHDNPEGTYAPAFSPDGTRLAYAARKGKTVLMVVDGQAGAEYDGIGDPVFSPDGRRLAYLAFRAKKPFVVVDGKETGLDGDAANGPVFTPDSKRLVSWVRKDRKWSAVVDGQAGPPYDKVGPVKAFFSPDGKRMAYFAWKDGKMSMVLDGQAGPAYDEVGALVFSSPDGQRTMYAAKRRGKWVVVVDGQEGTEYQEIDPGSPAFSPDAKHVSLREKPSARGDGR